MADTYFKVFGQKTAGKLILVTVVDEDFLGNVPNQFELQGFMPQANIYTGTYPTLKLNTNTIKDVTERFTGIGIAGILTDNEWYCVKRENKNSFGINL